MKYVQVAFSAATALAECFVLPLSVTFGTISFVLATQPEMSCCTCCIDWSMAYWLPDVCLIVIVSLLPRNNADGEVMSTFKENDKVEVP